MLHARRSKLAAFLLLMALTVVACGSDTQQEDGDAAGEPEPAGPAPEGERPDSLVLWNTAGGVWNDALGSAITGPFTEETGIDVLFAYFCCGLSRLKTQVESGNVIWHVAAASSTGEYIQGIEEDLYEELDLERLPLDAMLGGDVAEVGYGDGSYGAYGVKYSAYAAGVAWNTDVYPADGDHPETLADVFDTERFPGTRCMGSYPQYQATLESALLADGVPPEDLYPLDVDRALAKLDTIKDQIVWWGASAEAVQFILDGECDIGLAANGRVYSRVVEGGAPLGFAWDNAIVTEAWLTIPRGAPHYDAAHDLIAYFLDAERDAMKAEVVPYPAPLEGVYDNLSDVAKEYATAGPNLDVALKEDPEFYAENIDEIVAQFNAWRGQ